MARAVVVLCDVHLEQGERVEAEELPPITVEDGGPRVLALCPDHKRDYYDPFVELVADLARDASEDEGPSEPAQGVTLTGWSASDGTDSGDGSDRDESDRDESADESDRDESEDEDEADDQNEQADPDEAVAESPAMSAVPDQPDTARWDCPMDGCDKSYSASGDNRAEELKRLGNLHLSTAHHLDKAARSELLSA